MSLLITGGRLVDQTGERSGDVLVDDDTGTIIDVGPDLKGDREVDASNAIVAPAFVDLHVDIGEPGNEAAETAASAAAAAAAGGFGAIVAMPVGDPCADSLATVEQLTNRSCDLTCEIVSAAAVSVGRGGEALAPLAELAHHGVSIFSDARRGVQHDQFMRRALEYLAGLEQMLGRPMVLAEHCVNAGLAAGGVMHEGAVSSRLGLAGQPAEAEELMVMRDITLSRLTGGRVHFQAISTAGSVAMIRAAKAGGLAITAEVTPHHLLLTHEACAGFDPMTRVEPPLRTEADVAALRAAVADGTIDAIASDHTPLAPDAKERPFDSAPAGIVGLETTFGVARTALPDLPIVNLIAALSWKPAAIAGLGDRHGRPIQPGEPAHLVVIEPDTQWTVNRHELCSRASNTPFHGHTLTGRVRHTIHRGREARR